MLSGEIWYKMTENHEEKGEEDYRKGKILTKRIEELRGLLSCAIEEGRPPETILELSRELDGVIEQYMDLEEREAKLLAGIS